MESDYNLSTFKFTIDLFNDISDKLSIDFEEAVSSDMTFIDYAKKLEKFYGIELDIFEFNKKFQEERPDLVAEQNQKRNSGILFSVLGAFVCELALKYLITINGNKFERVHNLKTLYQQLHAEQQSEIKKKSMKKCKFLSEKDFDLQLSDSAENFKDLRYFFDRPEHNLNFIFLKGFKDTLLEMI